MSGRRSEAGDVSSIASLCRALLFLDVAYCATALVVPGLPGWKMFESSEHARYSLRDANDRDVDAYAWVPRAARDLSEHDLERVAAWICKEHHAPAPLRLDTANAHVVFTAPDCQAHEAK